MNNFTKRTITGFSFIGVVIASIVIHPLLFAGLFLIVTLLSLHEFYHLITKEQVFPLRIPAYISAIMLYTSFWIWIYYPEYSKYLVLNALALFLPFIFQLFTVSEKPFQNIAYTYLGILYIVIPFSLLGSFYFFKYPLLGISYGVLFGFFGLIFAFLLRKSQAGAGLELGSLHK